MKIGGIFAIVVGVLNLFIGIASLSTEYADQAGGKLGFGIGAMVLGLYLLDRDKKKKEKQKEKEKWENEN